ncbi:hypothetical protein [Haloplanus halobius]|uniref:hypothetical protein n=1 Tax=Haloplanus halobius TaxID=2934938 RepID=UPI00200C5101|nr:hypothetical protein [Haloplanus sp. XH21]
MASKKFTLLELHFGDGTVQIGPATLGAGESSDAESEDEADADTTDGDASCPVCTVGKLLLAAVVLALLAAVVRKVLGGDEDLEELEDLTDLDAE